MIGVPTIVNVPLINATQIRVVVLMIIFPVMMKMYVPWIAVVLALDVCILKSLVMIILFVL